MTLSTLNRYRQCLPLCRRATAIGMLLYGQCNCASYKSRKRCKCLPLYHRAAGDIGEVARLRAEEVDPQPQSGLSANLAKRRRCFFPNPSACGTSPIRAIARQRRTLLRIHFQQHTFHRKHALSLKPQRRTLLRTAARTQISQRVCHSIGLSTINSQPTLRLIYTEENIATLQPHTHRLHCMFVQLHQSLNLQFSTLKPAKSRLCA